MAVRNRKSTPHHDACSFQGLPTEIVAKIFDMSIPRLQQTDTFCMKQAPWLLTHVCSGWRNLGLSCPELWSNISIHLDGMDGDDDYDNVRSYQGYLPILETVLKRSGPRPLTVLFRHGHSTIASQLIQLLVGQCCRWKYIDITVTPSILRRMSFIKSNLPLLESLKISGDPAEAERPPIDLFEVTPRLRKVTINFDLPFPMLLPWSQLLKCSITTDQDPLHILSLALNLRKYKAEEIGVAPWICGHSVVRHDNLDFMITNDHTRLLFLDLPSLKHLRLTDVLFPESLTAITTVIHRSSCHLQTLSLGGSYLSYGSSPGIWRGDSHQSLAFLRCLPELMTLKIFINREFQCVEINRLIQLLEISVSHTFLPKLTQLSLDIQTPHGFFDFPAFVNMLESRWYLPNIASPQQPPVSRLVEVYFCGPRAADFSLIARIEDMATQGMIISADLI
ncbi:hypothetical protein BD779DRAFT_1785269 [Infundibulicybe gibba]|nr:hypothetical protein BD779DRAFT_1785269 [Infundibulicybe gibba]